MICKVRRDFKIITDVLSRVSLVTSNIRGSSICSPKSLYKKTSNEILRELKAAFKIGESKVPRPLSVLSSLLWQSCVKQPALTYNPSPPRGGEMKDATKMNFSSCSDHSWIKTTAIFSSFTFEFEYFFFSGLLSLQHKTLVLWYRQSFLNLKISNECVRFHYILETLSKSWCLPLPMSWRWRTTLNSKMLISPDTLRVLLVGLEHDLEIRGFRSNWPSLIFKDPSEISWTIWSCVPSPFALQLFLVT